jgi:4-amino-4-deoxy-L-arabinose transferase-like glycosyltransferase
VPKRLLIRIGPFLLVCALVAALGLQNIGRSEFFYNVDETAHAVTGLFFYDLLRDLPLGAPMEYTFRYYAQYPALGLIHWPPFFYFVEGVSFLLFEPTPVTARVVVLLFALLGVVYWMRLVAEEQSTGAAVLSAILLFLAPEVLLYERVVMLEIPSLALCCAAAYYWWRFLGDTTGGNLFKFAVAASLALLTKQQSLYLAPLCVASLITTGRWRQMLTRRGVTAFLLAAVLVVPFYVFSLMTHGQTLQHDVLGGSGVSSVTSLSFSGPALFVARALYGMLGLPLLLLSLIGMVTAWWWARRAFAGFMLLWILSAVGTVLVFSVRADRYLMYALPPFLFFAAGPFFAAYANLHVRRLGWALAAVVGAWQVYSAWGAWQPFVAGYRLAAERLIATGESGVVLFDGELPGNFIFFVRTGDPARRWIVSRKALYVTRVMQRYGSKELVHDAEEIRSVLHRYGIKYVVAVQGRDERFAVQGALREYLRTSDFRLIQISPVSSNVPRWQGASLEMYEYVNATPRTERILRIPMFTLSHDIVVPIDKILEPERER